MDTCLVTVLMPVFNAEKYVAEAIESILNQTYDNFEFLIINDGSTDKSEDIILSYKDSRIVYIKNQRNIRLVATLNKGIRMAKGKYIMRMDADDISVPDRMQKQVLYMEHDPKVGVCGSFLSVFGETINPYISKRPEDDANIRASLLVQNSLGHPNVTIRKSVMIENNIWYDEKFYRMEDWGLWVSLMPFCEFHNIQEPLLYYRYVTTSESRMNKKDANHLRISSEIVRLFFSQIGVQCNENESKEIASLVKAPYVFGLNEKDLDTSFKVLMDKLEKKTVIQKELKSHTQERLVAFSFKKMHLTLLLLNRLGCMNYFQKAFHILHQKISK